MAEIKELYQQLVRRFVGSSILGTNGWNGTTNNTGGGSCGFDTFYNTCSAGLSFIFALALSQHEVLRELVSSPSDKKEVLQMQTFVDAQVLHGLKMLDLGCGYMPSFARLCRWLGAEVYTADIIPATSFRFESKFWDYDTQRPTQKEYPGQLREKEIQNHVCCDLNENDTLDLLISKTGGNLDLVTESSLLESEYRRKSYYCDTQRVYEIAERLLKENGFLCSLTRPYDKFFIKNGGKLTKL